MSKIISPVLIRFKNIPNYVNKIHLKLNNNIHYLNYIKFFKLLLNFVYLFKSKIEKYHNLANKFLYLNCSYYDFNNLHISFIFNKLGKKQLIFLYKNIIKLFNYTNYFIKYNLYNLDYFVFLRLKKVKNYKENLYSITSSIKYFMKKNKNFKKKIIFFINSLLKEDKFTTNNRINGIKCIYSGCLYKNSKKKSFTYSKGNISTSPIMYNLLYHQTHLKTDNGIIGIKVWLKK